MTIPDDTKQALYKNLGDETDAFLSHAARLLEKYANQWQLTNIEFMETNTVNLLFACDSALYGACVLKVCIPGLETTTEINCLRAYDGKGRRCSDGNWASSVTKNANEASRFGSSSTHLQAEQPYCRLLAYNLQDNILLLQRVIPGSQMWEVADYKDRARHMAHLGKDLHIPWDGQTPYPTYLSWMERIHDTLSAMGNMDDMLFYLNKAMAVYAELKTRHTQNCLLHGDLHHENMLLNAQGSYTIIDPKGVVDAPVMETARFLNNEIPCEPGRILEMVAIMSPIIGICEKDMLCSLFVDTALSTCWSMEEHFPTQAAFEEAKREALADCQFAYELMTQ